MKVSVIVPVYNVSGYIEACVDSLLSQTYQDMEIILVNDGSTDDSGEIIRRYAASDPRILAFDKPNGGLSDARNYGLERSGGELIAFVDGDDELEPDTLSENVLYFEENSLLDALQYPIIDFFGTPRAAKRVFDDIVLTGGEEIIPNWFANNLISYSVCNKLFRKSSIDRFRFRKNVIFEDAFFCRDIAPDIRHFRLTGKGGYCYRSRENSITSSAISYPRYKFLLEAQRGWLDLAQEISDPQDIFNYSLRTIWTHILYTNRWTESERNEVFEQLHIFCRFDEKAKTYLRECSLKHKILFCSIKHLGLRNTARWISALFLLAGK